MPNYTLPPDLASQDEAAKQQEALAQILMQRSLQPVQSGNSMSPVSPLQGIAQIIAARRAGALYKGALDKRTQLGTEYNQRMTEGVNDYIRQRFGETSARPAMDAELTGDASPVTTGANPRAAMVQALTSRNPVLQGLGAMDYKQELELNKPRVLAADTRLVFPGGERPDVTNTPGSKKAIPDNWASFLPPGAQRDSNDPPGMFRLKGPDGQPDVYSMEFDRGQLFGYKKLDNGPTVNLNGGRSPYHLPLSTPQGIFDWDARTGAMTQKLGPDGKPIMKATDDPGNRGAVAAAQHAGTVAGTLTEQVRQKLPMLETTVGQANALINEMVGSPDGKIKPHPGFQGYVGWTWKPGMRFIEGSPEANFEAILKQIKGRAFMQAYETLKGGGQITEIEGQKGTEALTRMSKAQNEEEFTKAARDFQEVLNVGLARARQQAKESPMAPPAAEPSVNDLLKKYGGGQ